MVVDTYLNVLAYITWEKSRKQNSCYSILKLWTCFGYVDSRKNSTTGETCKCLYFRGGQLWPEKVGIEHWYGSTVVLLKTGVPYMWLKECREFAAQSVSYRYTQRSDETYHGQRVYISDPKCHHHISKYGYGKQRILCSIQPNGVSHCDKDYAMMSGAGARLLSVHGNISPVHGTVEKHCSRNCEWNPTSLKGRPRKVRWLFLFLRRQRRKVSNFHHLNSFSSHHN